MCSTSSNNDQEPFTLFYAFVCLPEKGRAGGSEECAFLSQAESRAPSSFRMIGQRVALPEGRRGKGGEEEGGRGGEKRKGGGGGEQGGEGERRKGGGEQGGKGEKRKGGGGGEGKGR